MTPLLSEDVRAAAKRHGMGETALRAMQNFVERLDPLNAKVHSADATLNDWQRYTREYASGLARLRASTGVQAVSVNGSVERGRAAGYFQTRLSDGTLGYFQRTTSDCLQAALATCAQIPMHKVPDLGIDRQRLAGADPEEIDAHAWALLKRWLERYGLTLMVHPTPPKTGRWIGVIRDAGDFNDHCLVMSGRDPLWNATTILPELADLYGPAANADPGDIDYGLTIERR